MYLDKVFNVAVGAGRRPTPTAFTNLTQYATVISESIKLRSISELLDINVQLDHTSNLFVSNIISRVIAQLSAEYAGGLVSLAADANGFLKVSLDGYPYSNLNTQDQLINFAGAGDTIILGGVTDTRIMIVSIMLTVAGETNLTLKHAASAMSGPLDLGGTNEPRGFCLNHGLAPLRCNPGDDFIINSSLAVQVSGYITYYHQPLFI